MGNIRDRIKSKSVPVVVPVEVDGETYFLRKLQGKDINPDLDGKKFAKYLVFSSLVEENGDRVFEKLNEVDDVPLSLITVLAKHALDVNGLSEQAFPVPANA